MNSKNPAGIGVKPSSFPSDVNGSRGPKSTTEIVVTVSARLGRLRKGSHSLGKTSQMGGPGKNRVARKIQRFHEQSEVQALHVIRRKDGLVNMRETITFDHHAEHAWFHFAIRLLIILLLIFLLLVLTENSFGQAANHGLTPAEVRKAEQRLSDWGYWTGQVDGILDGGSKACLNLCTGGNRSFCL
jgi:hypothetical protein